MLGHYLSALSGFHYQTGSAEAKEKLDYTVKRIKEIQRDDGYFSGIPSTPFDTVFSSGGSFDVDRFSLAGWWVPWYSTHKIYAGLLDAYTFGGSKDALEIVRKMADWAIRGTGKMSDAEMQKMLTCGLPRKHANSEIHRNRPPLRTHRKVGIPHCGGILLRDGHTAEELRNRRKFQGRTFRKGIRRDSLQGHLRDVQHLQHA